jgi:hypothetical protein
MATGRDHRDPNLNKRDENIVPVQVSLKDIWEALMKKLNSFIFFIRGFPFVPILKNWDTRYAGF